MSARSLRATNARRERVVDCVALGLLKIAIGAWVLHRGLSHVSDDDYARTVIAEQFAHTPRIDPSGTSWLPLPFWVEGAAMMVAGRSMEVARAMAAALGAVSVAAPYLAMRAVAMKRMAAVAATAIAMAMPWNAWLGVATVPEAWAGALVAAGAIAMGAAGARAQAWAAAALVAASLSRYEAWPACAVFAAACARTKARRDVALALVAMAGPALWVAWNAHAHGSALHFVARVAAFHEKTAAAHTSMGAALLAYPRALVAEAPEAAAAIVAAIALADRDVRARWAWPLAAAVAIALLLVAGSLGGGAPTHHAARALAPLWWMGVGAGVDAMTTRFGGRKAATAAACVAASAWVVTLVVRWDDAPGRSETERRDAQIARGLDMRARGVASAEITPCAFEHFALIAAWGKPESATIRPSANHDPSGDCPQVVER